MLLVKRPKRFSNRPRLKCAIVPQCIEVISKTAPNNIAVYDSVDYNMSNVDALRAILPRKCLRKITKARFSDSKVREIRSTAHRGRSPCKKERAATLLLQNRERRRAVKNAPKQPIRQNSSNCSGVRSENLMGKLLPALYKTAAKGAPR